MKNAVGRDIPEEILRVTGKDVFRGSHAMDGKEYRRDGARVKPVINSEGSKLLPSIKDALLKCEIKDGMTLSFHHHFREGDKVLNMVMEEVHKLGIKNITICASSMGSQNNPIVYMIDDGTITNIQSSGVRGEIGKAISEGRLQGLAIMRSHGGRVRAIESGETHIDIAFIGAPTADEYGNLNANGGKANCGVLSYSAPDALYADKVVAITDCLVPFPNWPHQISQIYVDYVVVVDEIGDPTKIATGAAKPTSDQRKLLMASYCTEVVKRTPYFKDGFSYQTGVGGASIASTISLADVMRERNIHMSFGVGGITKPMCQLLEEGLARTLVDTQDFDEYAIQSVLSGEPIATDWSEGFAQDAVRLTKLGTAAAPGTEEKLKEVEQKIKDGALHVFDTKTFTVNGKEVTSYAPNGQELVSDGYFHESEYRSSPSFDLIVDGIEATAN